MTPPNEPTNTSWIFGGGPPPGTPQPAQQPAGPPPALEVRELNSVTPVTPPPAAPAAIPPVSKSLPPEATLNAASGESGPPAPKPQNPVLAEIETLIRARYPLLAIISWEEDRVLRGLGAIAATLKKEVWQWSINSGLCHYRMGMFAAGEGIKGTKDPLAALKEIAANTGEPTITVLKDFHPFLKEPGVVRALRDLAAALRSTYTTLVLLGSQMLMPIDLEKDITVLDFPLPGREDLLAFFDQLVQDLAGNPALSFENTEETRQRLIDAAAGLTMNEAENVFAKILVRHGRLTAADSPEVYREKQQIIRKSGLMEYIDPRETIDNVGGLKSLKEWLRKRRRAFNPKARLFGLPIPKGVLFAGVQGCGKSLCAKAVSRFWQMPLLRLDMGELFGSLLGASEENVRRAIRVAESVAPVIVWIDEIDKGFVGLGKGADSDAGTASRVFGTFLTWLQEKDAPVFVIATANNVEALPPELLRQGRFDEIFFIDLPNLEERREIFRIHLAQRMRNPARFDLEALARASEGFSGAEVEQAVISGLYDAFDRQMDINQEILMGAIGATRPLSVLMPEQIQKRRKWAEGRARTAS